MEISDWTYQSNIEIKNFKDLELEKQRLQLHQKFLSELLSQDKVALKKAMEPQNLISIALETLFNNSKAKNYFASSNFVASLLSLFLSKFFRDK